MVTAEDVGHELRRRRKRLGQTQAQIATAIGVARVNITQWESGKYLPSVSKAEALDGHFGAGGTLVSMIDSARSPQSPAPPPAPAGARPPALLEVFRRVGESLADRLARDAGGRPLGWQQNLQQDRPPSALSTAYGMKAVLLTGEPYIDLHALATELTGAGYGVDGWVTEPETSHPEVTATVIDALYRVGTALPVDEALRHLEASLDDGFSRSRPFLLSTALQTVTRLRPDSPLADGLIDDLLAARLDVDGIALWPEKNEAGLALPEPSAVHTARALVALREVMRYRDRPDVTDAVEPATEWLIRHSAPDYGVTEELVRPDVAVPATARIMIRHFTSAWVIRALTVAPQTPPGRLHSALRTLWSRFDPSLGLWAWGNGDLPIWMTLDAIIALRNASLTNRSIASPPFTDSG